MKNIETVRASLRLFNAVLVNDTAVPDKSPEVLLARTIPQGFILDQRIVGIGRVLSTIEEIVGLDGMKANASFHKSWNKVATASTLQLVIEQAFHYMTTYGAEALGCYDTDRVYIPTEHLEIPDVDVDRIPLTVVRGFTKMNMLDAILKLGNSGIALKDTTIDDLMVLIVEGDYKYEYLEGMKNRELMAQVRDFYGRLPSDPTDFLRYVVSKLTDQSMLIKNAELIGKIKLANGKHLDDLMIQAPDNLAEIFLRYKPIFLAMRSISHHKRVFNRLRKQAKTMHKTIGTDFLNSITGQIKNGTLDIVALEKALGKATIFRKIRLAYALQYRVNPAGSIVYAVRNGRSWAEEFSWDGWNKKVAEDTLEVVLQSIVDDLKEKVDGKQIFIPENINYALPATEKQFTGNLPSGSFVTVPEDMIVGVHWYDVDQNRIDLDLASIGLSGKIGWDGGYRTGNRSVMFSGDITSAPKPKGACEMFYFDGAKEYEPAILTLNYFNFDEDIKVPMKLFVASRKTKNIRENNMVDVNDIICSSMMEIDKKQNILGLWDFTHGEGRFYFNSTAMGNSISSGNGINMTRTREFLEHKARNPIVLNHLLSIAGADVTSDKTELGEDYIDLSPEALDKTTIIDLLVGE